MSPVSCSDSLSYPSLSSVPYRIFSIPPHYPTSPASAGHWYLPRSSLPALQLVWSHPGTSWYACSNRPDHPGFQEFREQGVHRQAWLLSVWHAAYQIPGRLADATDGTKDGIPGLCCFWQAPFSAPGVLPAACMESGIGSRRTEWVPASFSCDVTFA